MEKMKYLKSTGQTLFLEKGSAKQVFEKRVMESNSDLTKGNLPMLPNLEERNQGRKICNPEVRP